MIFTNTDSNLEEPDWLAFRYISGELSPAETADFEQLLADDQPARDAVVRAVQLSEVIAAAQSPAESPSEPPSIGLLPAFQNRWKQHLAWFSSGVAACILVAFALSSVGPSPSARSTSHELVGHDLADAWLERATRGSDTQPESSVSDSDADFATSDAPSWMVEAVRSLQSDGTPEEDDADTFDELES